MLMFINGRKVSTAHQLFIS